MDKLKLNHIHKVYVDAVGLSYDKNTNRSEHKMIKRAREIGKKIQACIKIVEWDLPPLMDSMLRDSPYIMRKCAVVPLQISNIPT